MRAHECYHCKQWIEEGEEHDCWTTTEQALTQDLSEDLRDAWERVRETAVEFGEQRIYASHNSIMFSRKSCYFFVRPKRNFLEVCIFLGRTVRAPQIRKAEQSSKTKSYHIIHIRHRDEVEAPITDWLREAYHLEDVLAADAAKPTKAVRKPAAKRASPAKKTGASKSSAAKKTGPATKTGAARKASTVRKASTAKKAGAASAKTKPTPTSRPARRLSRG